MRHEIKRKMPRTPYTPQELERLLEGISTGSSLSELATRLGRPTQGIVIKLRHLSHVDPSTWNSEITKQYRQAWYQEEGKELGRAYIQKNRRRRNKEKRVWYANGGRESRRRSYERHQESRIAWQQRYWEEHKDEMNKKRRRDHAKREFRDLGSLLNMGYAIRKVQLTKDQLRLTVTEPPKRISAPDIEYDFCEAISQLRYNVNCNTVYHYPTLMLSPRPGKENNPSRTKRFLLALEMALKEEIE